MSAELRGAALYFDCFSGIAGDMTLGALLDLGVPEEVVRSELAKLPVRGYQLTRERVRRGALTGTKIHVILESPPVRQNAAGAHVHALRGLRPAEAHDHPRGLEVHHHHEHPHAHYAEIRAMLSSSLSGDVLARSLAIFDRIAVVEAKLHGVTVDDVAFHEVGAVDSIVDVVGAAAALAWLAPSSVTARRVPLGSGTVDTAHGRLPVPAPATLELLTAAGAEVEAGGDGELTTPTGAAILAATASAYGKLPQMTALAVGWGAGDRELRDRPNLLRVIAGRPIAAAVEQDELVVIEANVDDMNPELCEPLLDALFAAGAVDAWLQPIVMKKGRPALLVAALCDDARRAQVTGAMLRESTTIGVRYGRVARTVLARRVVEVDTPYGKVPLKVAGEGEQIWNVAPEYESCRRLARERDVPVKLVYAAALAAFYRR